MNRRSFLLGAVAAPWVITTPGLLMPVRSFAAPQLWVPPERLVGFAEAVRPGLVKVFRFAYVRKAGDAVGVASLVLDDGPDRPPYDLRRIEWVESANPGGGGYGTMSANSKVETSF